jgi:hypothetical protein
VIATTIARAWALGGGPGVSRLVIDIDSTICQVFGKQKHGAAYGYTKVLGYHPILATRADTGEILHARLRKGSANTARGVRRFVDDLVARARRAGASGPMVIRFDSGFWSNETIKALARHRVSYTMTVRCAVAKVAATIAAIDEHDWVDIGYTPDGRAQVAETMYGRRQLIVRRTRLVGAAQARLWPNWRPFAFLTDLIRWTATTGTTPTEPALTVARTVRVRLLAMPGRLVNRSGTPTLHAPARWPWAAQFNQRLATIRAFTIPTG